MPSPTATASGQAQLLNNVTGANNSCKWKWKGHFFRTPSLQSNSCNVILPLSVVFASSAACRAQCKLAWSLWKTVPQGCDNEFAREASAKMENAIGHEELRAMQSCSTPEICVMLLAAIALLNCTLRQECSQACVAMPAKRKSCACVS